MPGEQTFEDVANGCRTIDGGWSRPAGLVFVTRHNGHWVAVDAGPAATAEDVTAVATTLADVTEVERRAFWGARSDLPAG